MNINNLFFNIHYCTSRQSSNAFNFSSKVTLNRTLQHHQLIFITGGKGCLIVRHKKYKFNGNWLLYIYPNLKYALEEDSEDPISFLQCILAMQL